MNNPNGGLPIPSPLPDPGQVQLDPEVEELWSSRALLLVLLLLILSFWVSYYLKVRRIRSIHETIVAMFAGMCVGAIVRLAPGHVVQSMIAFKSTILLNVLLPPIILNSGYQLKQENFFRNFAVILTFAFAGTFISAVALGVIVYLYSLLGLEGLSLTIVECLLFGSTLSATDPVTILAIFNALHVDPKLYSVIFGESILNDAVAIVMFETLSQFHGEKIHVLSFFHGVGIFFLTFFTSMALGVIFGLACSLMLKHSELGRYTEIESCLVFLIAYTSYFFSNALTMSGIVSLLFCGVTLKHYAYHNMSHRTQRTTRYMFGSLAQLSENFIFIYLGLSLFTQESLVYKPMFILVTGIAVCIARYCAVFPISKLINLVFRARGSRTDELPHSYQMMLFWAGLRGAVGVALAAGMKGEHAVALRTTVLVAVVMTVIVFGGTIGRMIEILGIRTGVEEDDDGESSDDDGAYHLVDQGDLEGRLRHSKRRSIALSSTHTSQSHGRYSSVERGADRDDGSGPAGTLSPHDSPYRDRAPSASGSASTLRLGGPKRAGAGAFRSVSAPASDLSTSSEDSDPDILPAAVSGASDSALGAVAKTSAASGDGSDLTRVWRDGQWFTVLDERYLLPVFSNATASRRQASRKALRAKRNSFQVERAGAGGDESFESAGGGSPYLAGGAERARHEVNPSFSDILSSLVAPALSSSTSSSQQPSPAFLKRRESNDALDLSSSRPHSASAAVSSFPTAGSLYASPNSPLPSVDLASSATPHGAVAVAGSTSSRPAHGPRSRGSVSAAGSGNASGTQTAPAFSSGSGTSTPVMPFGSGRRATASPALNGQGGAGGGMMEFDMGGGGGGGGGAQGGGGGR
ncbi:hypothetical protein JCM5296_006909 [Sporobolomyces johnsonii]